MRKEITITVEREGRDQGKKFVLKEMSAMRAEKWATRALLALSRSRIEIPDGALNGGMAALVTVGIQALSGIQFAEAEPLMDEMLGVCVKFLSSGGHIRDLTEEDIEEIGTLSWLRASLVELHTGFSLPALLLKSTSGQATGEITSDIAPAPTQSAA